MSNPLNPLSDEIGPLLKENFDIFNRHRFNERGITEAEWERLFEGKRRLTELGYFKLSAQEQSRLHEQSIKPTA